MSRGCMAVQKPTLSRANDRTLHYNLSVLWIFSLESSASHAAASMNIGKIGTTVGLKLIHFEKIAKRVADASTVQNVMRNSMTTRSVMCVSFPGRVYRHWCCALNTIMFGVKLGNCHRLCFLWSCQIHFRFQHRKPYQKTHRVVDIRAWNTHGFSERIWWERHFELHWWQCFTGVNLANHFVRKRNFRKTLRQKNCTNTTSLFHSWLWIPFFMNDQVRGSRNLKTELPWNLESGRSDCENCL